MATVYLAASHLIHAGPDLASTLCMDVRKRFIQGMGHTHGSIVRNALEQDGLGVVFGSEWIVGSLRAKDIRV
eukprot:4668624-Pyramimonas_sp.AAC.1